MKNRLPSCTVRSQQGQYVAQYRGFLYIKNERVVVLLNTLVEGADLGTLQNIRYKYVEPEADMIIIPIHQVSEIAIDTGRKCIYRLKRSTARKVVW